MPILSLQHSSQNAVGTELHGTAPTKLNPRLGGLTGKADKYYPLEKYPTFLFWKSRGFQ